MDDVRRLTVREWAAELSPAHKRLTLEEARLLVGIMANDRLVEIEGAIADLKGRMQVLDAYLERQAPGYRHPDDMKRLKDGGS